LFAIDQDCRSAAFQVSDGHRDMPQSALCAVFLL
jgi:hypothetical protein